MITKKTFRRVSHLGLLGSLSAFTTLYSLGTHASSTCSPGKSFTITSSVPHDVNKTSQRLDYSQACNEEAAYFAWQQFLALSWQSNYSEKKPTRGTPDTTWDYSKAYIPGQPLVWETYAHRSELRPAGTPLNTPFDKPPTYLFVNQPSAGPGNPSFSLFNNLDEDNEIGSCDIYLGQGKPATQDLVLYQAKVNAAEYDYIKTTFGAEQNNPKGTLAKAATANQQSILKNKKNSPKGINLPAGKYGGSEGAIEIKTAFLRVTKDNKAMLNDFFKTSAIYYTADYDKKTKSYSNYQYHNDTFALLGIHIIHKTTAYPDFIFTSFEHEKLSNMDFKYRLLAPLPPTYSDFNPHDAPAAPAGNQTGNRQAITRQSGSSPTSNGQLYPIPPYLDAVTKKVHKQLSALNNTSVWLNYRLIGVQANITESWSATPSNSPLSGPNHFMANHVIESDAFLGNFFGPGFGSNPFPTGSKGNGDNIALDGNTYNMGGCKGCHGVAQTSFGTDFSFLLDFGVDKPVVNPDTIHYHPGEP